MLNTTLITLISMRNAITASRACRAGLVGLALAIVSASLAEADYGPRTIVGEYYQQTSTTTSWNGLAESTCSNAQLCYVLFQPVPQKRALVVQHVSCGVSIGGGDLNSGHLLTRKGEASVSRWTRLSPVRTGDNGPWVVNNPVMHLLKSGELPVIRFDKVGPANWSIQCSISGILQQ